MSSGKQAWRGIIHDGEREYLRAQGGVSLLCRSVALGVAPTKLIVLRLPYQHWAYLWSTGGQTFER